MLTEPVLAAGLFCFWYASIQSTIVTVVPERTELSATNPYAVTIAAGFAIAIAVIRASPIWSIILTGALLLLQIIYWPTRFGQTSWIAYLMLLAVALGIGLYANQLSKPILVPVLAVYATVVAALLTLPNLSLSGEWGTTNGKSYESVEVAQSLASSIVVGLLFGFAAWRIGSTLRRRLISNTLSSMPSSEFSDRELDTTLGALSPRETEIYRLVVSGMSNREIAVAANIEESTVKSHVSSVLTKLDARSRAQLIASNRRAGTLDAEPRAELRSH